ncbi:hypothetical protein LZ31DRAFT_636915, partial [Colletotrichum somersetense]
MSPFLLSSYRRLRQTRRHLMPQMSGKRLGTRVNRHGQFSSPAQRAVKKFFSVFFFSTCSSPLSRTRPSILHV